MTAPDTHAAGFGEVQVASQLGERLYARVPLVGDDAADVATECVRLIPESVLQDAPALTNARVGIDRKSSPPAVVVSTSAPVTEPAVRFVLEMGCGSRFRREFVLLIDPPDLPAMQVAATEAGVVTSAPRVVPADEPRWGSSASGSVAPVQAAASPLYDAPLAEPPVKAVVAPRKAAPPRPKPAARPQVAARPKPASAPPPPVRAQEVAKPAAPTDRLVLADADPAATQPTPQQAARDAREEALTRQVEALTKEVARMREDMDKLNTRNRELIKEAESRTGWFAAAGLGIVLAGVGLGFMGRRREKKPSWRDNLETANDDGDAAFALPAAALPKARGEALAPSAPVAASSYYPNTGVDPVTDLDVTKLDVRESTHGTITNTTPAGTTMFPSDLVQAPVAVAPEKLNPLQSLDFSLDFVDTQPATSVRPTSPVFELAKPAKAEETEAARAALFAEIEKAHRESK